MAKRGRKPTVTAGMTDEQRKDYWRVRRNIYNHVRRKVLAQVYPQYPKRYRPEPTPEHLAMIREQADKMFASQQKSVQRRRATLAGTRDECQEIVCRWKSKGCVACGESFPDCLDAHHVGEKRHEISRLVRGLNPALLREELERCIVLCANCHRKHHAGLPILTEATYPN